MVDGKAGLEMEERESSQEYVPDTCFETQDFSIQAFRVMHLTTVYLFSVKY